MATQQGLVSWRVVDQYGIPGTTDFFITIDDTQTVAQLIDDVVSFEDTLTPLSQASEVEILCTIVCHRNADPTPGTGDIEKGGLFNFANGSDPYASGYWVPDVNPSILNGSGLIDLTNTNVTNFIDFMTTAHTAITIVTKGVRALTALKDALISFRKHRKPLSRKTKEI